MLKKSLSNAAVEVETLPVPLDILEQENTTIQDETDLQINYCQHS